MPRKLYWCGDDIFRGCILRECLERVNFRVLIPGAMRPTGFLGRHGSSYPLWKASKVLQSLGCSELAEIDEHFNIRGQGDIDLLAVKGDVNFAAEVKSRLIISILPNFSKLKQMLAYHLGDPTIALKAWNRLFPDRSWEGYDNPGSIAELVREAVAAYFRLTSGDLIIGGIFPSYLPRELQSYTLGLIESSEKYLRDCDIPVKGSAILIVKPLQLGRKMIPRRIELQCIGKRCPLLGAEGEIPLSYANCLRNKIFGCRGLALEGEYSIKPCRYYKKCIIGRML